VYDDTWGLFASSITYEQDNLSSKGVFKYTGNPASPGVRSSGFMTCPHWDVPRELLTPKPFKTFLGPSDSGRLWGNGICYQSQTASANGRRFSGILSGMAGSGGRLPSVACGVKLACGNGGITSYHG